MVVVTIGIGSRSGDDQPERSCCAPLVSYSLSLAILVYSFAHLVPLFSLSCSVRALLLFSVCHRSRPHPLLYPFDSLVALFSLLGPPN